MTEFEYRTRDYVLVCKVVENDIENGKPYVVITGARGSGSNIVIPQAVEYQGQRYLVRCIGKKAFLGLRGLRTVEMCDLVDTIEDWAFAQCDQLESVKLSHIDSCASGNFAGAVDIYSELPSKTALGIGVFDGCHLIQKLLLRSDIQNEDYGILLGTCVNKLHAEDLLRDDEVGNAHWYQKWDQRLCSYILEDDSEGYQTLVLCGEEDIKKDVPQYVFDKQMSKCELCMIRLLHDESLKDISRQIYIDYLLAHKKGCESDAAWKMIIKEHPDDMEYYEMLANVGGITSDNINAMIDDMTAEHTQAKAYLIRYKQENMNQEDVFAGFEL